MPEDYEAQDKDSGHEETKDDEEKDEGEER